MRIQIDNEKCICKNTDLCREVCPFSFIIKRDNNNHIILIEEYDKYCINCGHCACICPGNAIQISKYDKSPLPLERKEIPSAKNTEQLLKSRRSVRKYKDQPVSKQKLEELLSVTRWVPTATNKQKLKWVVVESKEKIQTLAGLTIDWIKQNDYSKEIAEQWEKGEDLILRNAPNLIIVLGKKNDFWTPVEGGIALTYIELFAHSMGLGTCWAGYFTKAANFHKPLEQYLALPEGYQVAGAVMIGYPVYRLKAIPRRNPASITWK